jgi:hypothetical protein
MKSISQGQVILNTSHLHAGPSGLTHDQVRKSRSGHFRCIAPHAVPLGLMHDHEDIIMDHLPSSISPSLDDGAEVYGLSNLRRSQRIADGVEKIGQQRWGSNASVQFVNNGEESNEEEEEEEEEEDMEDEPISDFDD